MTARNFPTAQDAENAFYEALERCDLEGMMAVWAEDEDIVCVHPGGPRLTGHDQIREAFVGADLKAGCHVRQWSARVPVQRHHQPVVEVEHAHW